MKKHFVLHPVIFLLVASILILSGCQKSPPNIILINIDDMGWRDVGFMGSEFYETPHIDRLAVSGMVFTNGYAPASNCAPSRASLMSGQWTPRHGIYTVNNSDRGQSRDRKLIPTTNTTVLADTFVTIPELLREAGYKTCHAGKWHLGKDPKSQGFDRNIGGTHAGNPGSYYPPYGNVPLKASDDDYLTDLIMDFTIAFIRENHGSPFFLYYSPYAVHTPIHPIDSLFFRYVEKASWMGQDHAGYASMVDNLDRNIGNMLNVLEEEGKSDMEKEECGAWATILIEEGEFGHGRLREKPLNSMDTIELFKTTSIHLFLLALLLKEYWSLNHTNSTK